MINVKVYRSIIIRQISCAWIPASGLTHCSPCLIYKFHMNVYMYIFIHVYNTYIYAYNVKCLGYIYNVWRDELISIHHEIRFLAVLDYKFLGCFGNVLLQSIIIHPLWSFSFSVFHPSPSHWFHCHPSPLSSPFLLRVRSEWKTIVGLLEKQTDDRIMSQSSVLMED